MGEPNAKLWIGNLCYKVEKEDLDQLFRKYGLIIDIKILDKGPHVYAFVEFDKVESGIEAFKNLQGHDLKGQAMKIEYSCGRKRSNHRDRDHDQKYRGKRESYKRRSRSRSNDKHKKKSKSSKLTPINLLTQAIVDAPPAQDHQDDTSLSRTKPRPVPLTSPQAFRIHDLVNKQKKLMNQDQVPYYFFFNTSSGGTRGAQLLQLNCQTLKINHISLQFYNLSDQPSRQKGFDQILLDKSPSIRLVVAGGDGSIMWIIELMIQYNVDISKCIIIPLPFGTGNDFANALGWGVNVPVDFLGKNYQTLSGYIDNWKNGQEIYFDIWDLEMKVALVNGKITEIKTNAEGYDQVELKLVQNTFTKKLANYFSIGVDARIGYGFDKQRTNSRMCNKFVYCWEGFKKMFIKTVKVNDAIENLELMDDIQNELLFKTNYNGLRDSITVPGNPCTLLGLNINSYSGGVKDIWKNAAYKEGYRQYKHSTPSFSDGKLEFLSFNSILGIGSERMIAGNATRLSQTGGPLKLNFRKDEELKTYFQVDGQYYAVQNPVFVQINGCNKLPNGKIKVLQNIQQFIS